MVQTGRELATYRANKTSKLIKLTSTNHFYAECVYQVFGNIRDSPIPAGRVPVVTRIVSSSN